MDQYQVSKELLTCFGLIPNLESFYVLGTNTDIDSGTLPEDLWDGGGVYTGFPTGTPERIELFSSNAGDTGFVTIRGLRTSASTRYTTETIQLNGVTPVQSVNTWYRVNQGSYISGAPTTFNLGTITCRHVTTTANVFFVMPTGRSISAVCGFTVPANAEACLSWMRLQIGSTTPTDFINASLWFRPFGLSPILPAIFPIEVGVPYTLDPYIGVRLSPGSDFIIRALESAASNLLFTGRLQIVVRYF